jgi:hypothetical protein
MAISYSSASASISPPSPCGRSNSLATPHRTSVDNAEFQPSFLELQSKFANIIDYQISLDEQARTILRHFLSTVKETEALAQQLRVQVPALRSDPFVAELLASIREELRIVECFVDRLLATEKHPTIKLESEQLMRRATRETAERMGPCVLQLFSLVTTARALHEEALARRTTELNFTNTLKLPVADFKVLSNAEPRRKQNSSNIQTPSARFRDGPTRVLAQASSPDKYSMGIAPHSVILLQSRTAIDSSGKSVELTGVHRNGKVPVKSSEAKVVKLDQNQIIVSYPLRFFLREAKLPIPRNSLPKQLTFYQERTPLIAEQKHVNVTIDLAGSMRILEVPENATSVKVLFTCAPHISENLTRHSNIVRRISPPATVISTFMQSALEDLASEKIDLPKDKIPHYIAAAFVGCGRTATLLIVVGSLKQLKRL